LGLLLPDNSTWKGSLLTTGNYAFAGGINWNNMGIGPSIYGMATMGTDTGHNGIGSDMTWAKRNKQAQDDWGFRALNGSVAIAKKITDAYYRNFDRKLQFSYYSGCSTGGRQGLKQIQVDQTSFDGVLVGAPAWEQYGLMPWIAKLGTDYLNSGANGSFTQAQWNGMILSVRAACDQKDSVIDNIISRPNLCNFDEIAPSYLQCGGTNARPNGQCLQANQIPVARKFYQDYVVNGTLVFNAPELGAEMDLGIGGGYLAAGVPEFFDREWAKNFLDKPSDYTYTNDLPGEAKAANPGQATADHFNIARFKQNRGKLIMYQGLADGVIPSEGTTRFYEMTRSSMGGDINSFVRYFQVPGMHHCFWSDTDGGSTPYAPWMFGGTGQYNLINSAKASQVIKKPETDAFQALVQWVEASAKDENAPGPTTVTATTWWANNNTVFRQRPLCAYPRRATLKEGNMNPDVASSWTCS
jgi:feruloyl esterase